MVYVPGLTKTLYRRKGGGKGNGGGGGGGVGSGGAVGKMTRGNVKGLPAGKTSATMYGNGGGTVSTIQSGFFTGRTIGGGTRTNIFGNRFVRIIFCHSMNPFSSIMERFCLEIESMGVVIPGTPSV